MFPPYPYRAKEFAFIHAGGLFHLFYMRHDLSALDDDSSDVDVGHAVSQNLTDWTQLDPVLHVRPDNWDNWHVWAPTIICQKDTFYMYYTGVTRVMTFRAYQRIGLATSTDLVHWSRYDAPVFDGNRVPWAFADSSQDAGCQFRDPFVMVDPGSPGRWLMYYVTIPRDAIDQLITGVGFNETGMSPWHDLMPLWNTDAAHYQGFIESPVLFPHDARWYLFFTTKATHTIRYQYANSPTADSSGWVGTYRLFDDDPTTDDWFAPEFLKVGEHEYFAAVNSGNRGIEIREMVWSGVATFSLVSPKVEAVAVAEGTDKEEDTSIETLRDGARGGLKFRVMLPRPMRAEIGIYDMMGRRVRVLNRGPLPGGETILFWDGKNGDARPVVSGVYFARMETPLGSRSTRARVLR